MPKGQAGRKLLDVLFRLHVVFPSCTASCGVDQIAHLHDLPPSILLGSQECRKDSQGLGK